MLPTYQLIVTLLQLSNIREAFEIIWKRGGAIVISQVLLIRAREHLGFVPFLPIGYGKIELFCLKNIVDSNKTKN